MVSVVITVVHVEVVVAVVSVVVSRDVPLVASGGAVVSGVAVGGGTAAADSVLQTGTAAAVETGGADSDTVSRTAVLTSGAIACVRGSAASLHAGTCWTVSVQKQPAQNTENKLENRNIQDLLTKSDSLAALSKHMRISSMDMQKRFRICGF